MQKRKFTIVTQLHENNNTNLIEYIDTTRVLYAKAMRETFHILKRVNNINKSSYNTYLQKKYDITSRTTNSIIFDAQGRLNALAELKKYEKSQLIRKINHLANTVIPKLVEKRNAHNDKLRQKLSVSLVKHRNLRRKIVAKKSKLNHLKQKLENLNHQLETGLLKLCFGTKHLLQRDYEQFVNQRDSQMSFVGSKTEKSCNSQLQLTFNPKNNQFDIQLRKDFGFKTAKGDDRYVYGKVYFRHHKNHIISILRQCNSPLSYKIIKKNNRFYLYCTFEIQVCDEDFVTHSSHGTIGLDFNKGFITLSETNQYGHLVQTQFLPYRFKAGNKTKTDLQHIAKHVITLARSTGKDICIEDLNFKNKKAQTESKSDKKYNDMLHSFAYQQFMATVESCAYRNQVIVNKVNPAWTSWLAKQLYCPTMKLNVHTGASYVIARRGQGYNDSV